jgi:hypothetical protein
MYEKVIVQVPCFFKCLPIPLSSEMKLERALNVEPDYKEVWVYGSIKYYLLFLFLKKSL